MDLKIQIILMDQQRKITLKKIMNRAKKNLRNK